MVLLDSPSANTRLPLGRPALSPSRSALPKSAALATLEPRRQATEALPLVSPVRVTVKVKAVVPPCPSARLTWSALMLKAASSLRMVPSAVPWLMVSPVVPAPRVICTL